MVVVLVSMVVVEKGVDLSFWVGARKWKEMVVVILLASRRRIIRGMKPKQKPMDSTVVVDTPF